MARIAKKAANAVDQAVGGRLRMLRKLRGVTQPQLGAVVGVSFQQIQRYERGENALSVSMLLAVSEALSIRPDDLLGQTLEAEETHPSPEIVELIQAMRAIKEPKARQSLLDLARLLQRLD